MRRANLNMSWSDSMASSITLAGSRVANARRARLHQRPSPLATQHTLDPELQRLIREQLSISAIPEENEQNDEQGAEALESSTPTPNSISTSSRSKRLALKVKSKMHRFIYLLSYYLSRLAQEYGSNVVFYRPLQFGVY